MGKNFDAGVLLQDLAKVEECFHVGIYVYSLEDKKVAKVICLTEIETENTCHLNSYEDHFSFISKFKSYAKKYQCSDYSRFTSRADHLARHRITCKADEIKESFVGENSFRRTGRT